MTDGASALREALSAVMSERGVTLMKVYSLAAVQPVRGDRDASPHAQWCGLRLVAYQTIELATVYSITHEAAHALHPDEDESAVMAEQADMVRCVTARLEGSQR